MRGQPGRVFAFLDRSSPNFFLFDFWLWFQAYFGSAIVDFSHCGQSHSLIKRPYGCVISEKKIVTISANIDAGQPWRRSFCDNVIYTDWKKDNFLKAIVSIIGKDEPPKNIGIENDHVTIETKEKLTSLFSFSKFLRISLS